MNKLIKKISKTLSKAFGFVGMVMVIAAVAFTVPAALATHTPRTTGGPSWNTGHTANETNWFQIQNATKGTGWSNSVAVSPGDLLTFQVYVHNDTCAANDATGNNQDQCPETTATHSFVKVNLPQSGGVVTATIGSDHTASNTSRNLTLTLPSGQTITYKTGSTQFRRHPIQGAWINTATYQDFLGADTVTTTGQSLGDIPGCYSQAVVLVFQAQVSNVAAPAVLGTTAKVLPSTGPETAPILALIGMIPTGIMLRRFKV